MYNLFIDPITLKLFNSYNLSPKGPHTNDTDLSK